MGSLGAELALWRPAFIQVTYSAASDQGPLFILVDEMPRRIIKTTLLESKCTAVTVQSEPVLLFLSSSYEDSPRQRRRHQVCLKKMRSYNISTHINEERKI